MKIVTNDALIKRNSQFGFWASIISPVVMAISASMYLAKPENIWQSLTFLTVGFIFYQIGIAFRKWGRGAETALNQALKKLGSDYTLYHFHTPVSHLLVGPAGFWIMVPRYAKGTVTYDEKRKRWKLERPTLLTKIFSVFISGIGRPGLEIIGEADALDRHLQKHWIAVQTPHLEALIVFMDDSSIVKAQDAPIPTVHIQELKAFMRNAEKEKKTSPTIISEFNQLFAE